MAFTLPALPYAYDALEPHIDAQTMQIHHDRHHKAYVDNLNAALAKHPEFDAGSDIEALLRRINEVPEDIRTAVRNNGGGEPTGAIAEAMAALGGYSQVKTQLIDAGKGRFGSGWAWLVVKNGSLAVTHTANQDSPLMEGQTPVLGIDVWEHAYYLRYQNKRPDYLDAWFNTVNWDAVNRRFESAGR